MLQIVERVAATAVRHVTPVPPGEAQGLVARVYAQARADFLLVPPFTIHSSVPEVLAGAWSIVRETLLAGLVQRGHKEAIAATVSKGNACPYCVDVHLAAAGAASAAARALGHDDERQIADPQMRALVGWAKETRRPGCEVLGRPPFGPAEAPEVIGTALAFNYINRMVNLFCDDSPVPVPGMLAGLRPFMRTLATPMIRPVVGKSCAPGDSLELLPRAVLPGDMEWAKDRSEIAAAWAGFADVVERHVRNVVDERVIDCVRDYVATWRGTDPSLGQRWLGDAVAPLPESDRPAGRLALLTALASYQVDGTVIDAFRRTHPGDAPLIALTAWASFTATRRIGTWLRLPET
jgi:AhpD family alkylhydroperoxidase